ncbi:hypothetical protein HELRODRAFT_192438 [Helobdella robusta]|uniref:CD109 antigen n=1 Tax=Helobdella robusta TaxID=6412 RepID=T1FTY7_HELRO|nr:hypothetical protein HELRODRAFT_192438 [Helobdella robusta]ESO00830.1 hypothetical protein HELRODRAFT_192438 [Helobdella robusta]
MNKNANETYFDKGVVSGQLKLSDITPLGDWMIEAISQGLTETKTIQVAEYVLPKFEVKVILPPYFHLIEQFPSKQDNLLITITAIYTYGKPVKGSAMVSLELESYYAEGKPRITKNLMVGCAFGEFILFGNLTDGKADLKMTVAELSSLAPQPPQSWFTLDNQVLNVSVDVTETATGIVLSGVGSVEIVSQRYLVKFLDVTPKNFKPGFKYFAYVQLTQKDESEPKLADIQDASGNFKNLTVKITLTNTIPAPTPVMEDINDNEVVLAIKPKIFRPFIEQGSTTTHVEIKNVSLTQNGFVLFSVETEALTTSISLEVSFYDSLSNTTSIGYTSANNFQSRDGKLIQISLIDPNQVVKSSQTLRFHVNSSEPIKSFQYQLLGKGGIQYSNVLSTNSAKKLHTLSVKITAELASLLAPEARVVVFYVTTTGELVADSLALSVVDYFSNKVSLSFSKNSTEPGKAVVLRVNSSPHSYVSLLAVDQSVLLLSSIQNEINRQIVFNDLGKYAHGDGYVAPDLWFRRMWCPIWLGGVSTQSLLENAGLFVLTNYFIKEQDRFIFFRDRPMMRMMMAKGQPEVLDSSPSSSSTSPKPRKDFPETWIWSDVVSDDDGKISIKYTVPDTITSWVATAFATSDTAGLGVFDNPAKVTIFNYLDQDVDASVSLPKSSYYKVSECAKNVVSNVSTYPVVKIVKVKKNDVATLYFWIVPTALGQVSIQVKATTPLAGDAVIMNLLVKPEGAAQSYSTSSLIRMPSNDPSKLTFDVTLPPANILVEGSVVIEATVIGDILGTSIKNLDGLLQMPYGCGEQNLLTMAPDVYILIYLTLSNQLTSEIENKAKGFILQGYQKELTYQRFDGSFSAFGNSDPAGSIWLSSMVIKVFRQAHDYIPIDDAKIAQTLNFIIPLQAADGSFAEPPLGRVIHTDMQGGSGSGVALTAYVLIALLHNKNVPLSGSTTLQASIQLAVTYLEGKYSSLATNSYALSIIAYAFYLSGSSHLDSVLMLLDQTSVSEENYDRRLRSLCIPTRPQSSTIETAAYVPGVYANRGDLSRSPPVAKWLIKQRNSNGGFSSTQDTVLGLEALAMFARMVNPQPSSSSAGLSVYVTQDGDNEYFNFTTITRFNALLLQSTQMNVKYNVKLAYDDKKITQKLSVENNDNRLTLKICIRFEHSVGQPLIQIIIKKNLARRKIQENPNSWTGNGSSGMVLTEVNMLTGYVPIDGYVENLQTQIGAGFKRAEFNKGQLAIYLDELTKKEICFKVSMTANQIVNGVKAALVKTYRYYEPKNTCSPTYE